MATGTNTGSTKPLQFCAVAITARILQILQLYLEKTPSGGSFVERPILGISSSIIVNLAAFSFLAALFALSDFLVEKKQKKFHIGIASITWIYLVICAINDQILRWMGQHLTLSYLSTYSITKLDPTMTKNIISDGFASFTITIAILTITAIAFFIILKKKRSRKFPKIMLASFAAILLIISGISGFSKSFFKPCRIRWHLIQPPYITLLDEIEYRNKHNLIPENYKHGLQILEGNYDSPYPFYHAVENEDSLINAFIEKPFTEKKDVILLSLESFRGWAGDFRIGANCKRMPNLCKYASKGTSFPYTYSVGYPSTEGMLGLQLGIWSHPNKIFLSSLMNIKSKALPEILGIHGYHRIVLTAAEPSFDNFSPWFTKWFDVQEYNPNVTTDIPLAERFKEMYEARPANKPLYFEWINFVTHTPFNVPSTYAKPAPTSDERYDQALAYLDSALGIILNTIENSPRKKETIVIVTGDHSIANAKAQQKLNELGETSSAYTWTNFIWTGPSIPDSTLVTRPVSHVDFAPTLLNLLGIKASNHFVGHNLFEDSSHPAFSFRHSDAVMRNDSIYTFAKENNIDFAHIRKHNRDVNWDTTNTIGGFFAEEKIDMDIGNKAQNLIDAMNSWIWVLDNNLLMP